jgi:glycosyltransferase involved in cell wall biosynthesis
MRILVPLAARTAHRIISISQSTAQDVRRFLRTRAEKIDIIPLGLGATKTTEALSEAETRARFSLERRPILLTMAAKRPHKNLMRLLDALAAIPFERRPILVLPGYATAYEAVLQQHAESLHIVGDVRFRGWISAEEAEGLYACATAFVFPSLYEGFGMPVLEAMARGVPVACSHRGSLNEVAGSAALVFDPEDTGAITMAIETLFSDQNLAQRLKVAGKERAAEFSWERTAAQTIATYEKVILR